MNDMLLIQVLFFLPIVFFGIAGLCLLVNLILRIAEWKRDSN